MRVRVLLAVFAIAMGAAAAWSSSEPAAARVPAAGVQVQLLDPGAAPRALLRIAPNSVPTSRTITFSTQVTQSGSSTAMMIGPLQIQAAVSILASLPSPKGTIRVPYTYGRFQLLDTSAGTPQELDSVRTSLAQFQGFSGEYTLSSTGAVLANRFHISSVNPKIRSLLQQLSDQSGQLTVPLPTKAVGIGAHWRGTTQLVAGGIHFRQTYDYTLRSRDGGRLTLDVRYTQIAPRQQIKPAGLAAGVTVEVTNFRTTGTGVSGVDLSQAIPVSGHVTAHGVEQLRVRQGRRSETLDQQLQLGVDVAPS